MAVSITAMAVSILGASNVERNATNHGIKGNEGECRRKHFQFACMGMLQVDCVKSLGILVEDESLADARFKESVAAFLYTTRHNFNFSSLAPGTILELKRVQETSGHKDQHQFGFAVFEGKGTLASLPQIQDLAHGQLRVGALEGHEIVRVSPGKVSNNVLAHRVLRKGPRAVFLEFGGVRQGTRLVGSRSFFIVDNQDATVISIAGQGKRVFNRRTAVETRAGCIGTGRVSNGMQDVMLKVGHLEGSRKDLHLGACGLIDSDRSRQRVHNVARIDGNSDTMVTSLESRVKDDSAFLGRSKLGLINDPNGGVDLVLSTVATVTKDSNHRVMTDKVNGTGTIEVGIINQRRSAVLDGVVVTMVLNTDTGINERDGSIEVLLVGSATVNGSDFLPRSRVVKVDPGATATLESRFGGEVLERAS
mmetsp:Transcript_98664/g.274532  ORF Transcript_98664/g.274532 Transcript_98664/m.274532 type:complete len:421 (-) Transcript_98664:160-1422(-)